jgi:hypothetical protein
MTRYPVRTRRHSDFTALVLRRRLQRGIVNGARCGSIIVTHWLSWTS